MDTDKLIWKMTKVIVEHSGAQRGTLFMVEEETGQFTISAEYKDKNRKETKRGAHAIDHIEGKDENEDDDSDSEDENREQMENNGKQSLVSEEDIDTTTVFNDKRAIEDWQNGPQSVVNFVRRTLQPSMLPCAINDSQFGRDEYIVRVCEKG